MIDRLSPCELEIALACTEGGSPSEIAQRLFLGVLTVELQLASAMTKLGLKSTAELVDMLRSDTDLAVSLS